ncbi:MAG TPA: hypothetical protein VGR20_02585, partial [Acidimicrobiia bacterium]|nr:hypothetical protein [Acidimicrobiia bacterium]
MSRVWRPLALVLVVTGALPLMAAERGQAAPGPGAVLTEAVGSASARVAAAGPFVSGLSLETGFGTSTVDLSGEAARGESTTMSAGAAEFLLGRVVDRPVVPDPTRADSSGPVDAERSVAAPAGQFLRLGHEEAHAGPRRGEAATHLGDVGVGDAAAIAGGASAAAVDDTGAHSSTAIGELRLGGSASPAVMLSGLLWQVRQSPGVPAEASFSVGSASIGGQPLAVGSPDQIAAAIEAVNTALAPQGIRLHLPAVTAGDDGGRVEPLRIELRDPPLTRAAAGVAYSPVAPTVNSAEDNAAKATGSDPRFGQALLAANLALAALLGNGGAGLEVGGATASLGRREVPDLGSLFGGSKLPPFSPGAPGDGTVGTGGGSSAGADGSLNAFPSGAGGSLFDTGPGSGRYGSAAPGAGSDLLGSGQGSGTSTASEPPAGLVLGAGDTRGRSRPLGKPGHLPVPLAATALAGGLAIAGADWLARRRTVGLVTGLRSAAGLGASAGRPVRGRRTLAAAGVAVVTVLALA